MRVKDGLLPGNLYCWIFEHDDVFTFGEEPVARQYWCQRCFVQLSSR